jgi:hypothetical protein
MGSLLASLKRFYDTAAAGYSVTATTYWEEQNVESPGDPGRAWHAHGLLRPFATTNGAGVETFGIQGDLRLPYTTPWYDPNDSLGDFHPIDLLIRLGPPDSPVLIRVRPLDEPPENASLMTRILDRPIAFSPVFGQARFEDPGWLVMFNLREASLGMVSGYRLAGEAEFPGISHP